MQNLAKPKVPDRVDTDPEGLTRALASAVAVSRPNDLPQAVARHALRTFVNFVGCAAGGSRHEAVECVERAIKPRSGIGNHCVIGRAGCTDVLTAALLNAVAGAVNAFDDTHAEAVIHPGPPVGAALVALTSGFGTPMRGDEFLSAYAWGVELACRLSKAISVSPAETDMGWSQTGLAAPVGSAAACARLLGLNTQQTAWAIGIAATQASGLRVAHGSMAMHLAPARAAVAGLEAALLAEAGFTGPENALEGRYGHLALFARTAASAHLSGDLGTHFELLANTFKSYPCGIVIHAVIDACLALRAREKLVPAMIRELVLEVPPTTIALADKPNPDGVFAAQVSVQHWAAAALAHGKAGLEQGSLRAIGDPEIGRLREKCRLVSRPDLAADAAIVILETTGGRQVIVKVAHCTGSLANPLDDNALSRKFLDQATPILGADEASRLLDRCWSMPNNPDVRSIWRSA